MRMSAHPRFSVTCAASDYRDREVRLGKDKKRKILPPKDKGKA